MKNPTKHKFSPKLTFDQRCAYYLAFQMGASQDDIAGASGLDRSCVKRLVDKNYKAYFDVKMKYAELGPEQFKARFWDSSLAALIPERI
jgi:hypothetical protein